MVALDAGAADADAGQLEQRVAVHVTLRRRCDVADDVREVLALGVDARGADVDQHAGQVGRIHLNARHLLPGQELAHDDGHEAPAAAHVALDARALRIRQRHDAVEGLEHRRDVARLLGDEQRAPVEAVAGDHAALPVQHAPARGREQPRGDAVLLRERRVLRAFLDLQAPQPRGEEAEDAELQPAQRQRAAREDVAALLLRELRAAHGEALQRGFLAAAERPHHPSSPSARRIARCARVSTQAMAG